MEKIIRTLPICSSISMTYYIKNIDQNYIMRVFRFTKILVKLSDLTEFEKRQIVEALIAGSFVVRTADLHGFSRSTISRTMTEFKKHGKTSSNRSNSGQTFKLTIR